VHGTCFKSSPHGNYNFAFFNLGEYFGYLNAPLVIILIFISLEEDSLKLKLPD
jgi:hypothetical protein